MEWLAGHPLGQPGNSAYQLSTVRGEHRVLCPVPGPQDTGTVLQNHTNWQLSAGLWGFNTRIFHGECVPSPGESTGVVRSLLGLCVPMSPQQHCRWEQGPGTGTMSTHDGVWEAPTVWSSVGGRSYKPSLWWLHPLWPTNTSVGWSQCWLHGVASLSVSSRAGVAPEVAEECCGGCPDPHVSSDSCITSLCQRSCAGSVPTVFVICHVPWL